MEMILIYEGCYVISSQGFFSWDTLLFHSHEICPLKNVPFFSEVVYLIKIVLIALFRDGSRAAAISKIERFVIIVNGFLPLDETHLDAVRGLKILHKEL